MKFWMLLSWWVVFVNIFTMYLTGGWKGWNTVSASAASDILIFGWHLWLRQRKARENPRVE